MKSIYIAILILASFSASAQQSRQYSFTHLSIREGLASNVVSHIAQDEEGYIWIGTANGLQRYDGRSFITFRKDRNKLHSLADDNIQLVYKDKKGYLWLSFSNNKVGFFDTKTFRFKEVPIKRDYESLFRGKYFVETPEGDLLLVYIKAGIYKYIKELDQFVPDSNRTVRIPKGWIAESLKWDTIRKKYWIVGEQGIALYNPQNKKLSYRHNNTENDPVINKFSSETHLYGIQPLANGDLIFAQWIPVTGSPSFFHYNNKTGDSTTFFLGNRVPLGYHEVSGYLEQKNGRFWMYGSPFLIEWDYRLNQLHAVPNEYKNEQSIKFDYLHSAYEDRDRNIWLCTDNGLYIFNPESQVFNIYNLVRPKVSVNKEAPIHTVIEINNKIMVGTWGEGIYLYDQQFNPLPLPSSLLTETKPGVSIWDMLIHSKTGKLWIVYQGGKILVYDSVKNKAEIFFPEVFEKRTIRQIVEDQQGNLWFGSQSGNIIKWTYDKANPDHKSGFKIVYKSQHAHKMYVDKKNNLWVATFGDGLLKINPVTESLIKRFTDQGPANTTLSNSVPLDVFEYNDSVMVVIANVVNLLNTKTNKVEQLTTEDGLPSMTTVSGLTDDEGILWIGMLNGICRVNIPKKTFILYDRRDGILHDKFHLNSAYHLRDGRMVFVTHHDIVVFNPKKIDVADKPVKPTITAFRQGHTSYLIDSLFKHERLVLPYNKNSIVIEFSSLQYLKQNIHFFYKLEGLDKEWIHTESAVSANYNYLPPGDYTFKVKSENADGITSEETSSFVIVVRPPFWNTWWFYGLVILAVLLILYLLDAERVKRQKSLQNIRTQIAGNLHREVNETLTNINVLSDIAKIKADKNIEQSKEFIDQISNKSKYMIEAMDDMLWTIDPLNDNMRKTILRIKEITEGLITFYKCDIDLIVDHKVERLELDMKQRHEFLFFYKETMSFLLQRLQTKQVFVNINQKRSKLLMEILTECEEKTNLKTVLGKVVKQRAEALGAHVEIMSDRKTLSVMLQVDL